MIYRRVSMGGARYFSRSLAALDLTHAAGCHPLLLDHRRRYQVAPAVVETATLSPDHNQTF
jgi:hypothetical protein